MGAATVIAGVAGLRRAGAVAVAAGEDERRADQNQSDRAARFSLRAVALRIVQAPVPVALARRIAEANSLGRHEPTSNWRVGSRSWTPWCPQIV